MGVVLTLPGEEWTLGRLGVGVQTKATPRPGALVMLPISNKRQLVFQTFLEALHLSILMIRTLYPKLLYHYPLQSYRSYLVRDSWSAWSPANAHECSSFSFSSWDVTQEKEWSSACWHVPLYKSADSSGSSMRVLALDTFYTNIWKGPMARK